MKIIKLFILLLSIISTLIIFLRGQEQWPVGIIPFLFGTLIFIFLPSNIILGSGLLMMLFVSSMRYIIYPPLLFVDIEEYSFLLPQLEPAIYYSICEIFIIVITINLYYRNKNKINNLSFVRPKKIFFLLPVLFIIVVLFIYIEIPSVYANQHFILNTSKINEELFVLPGYIVLFLKWAEVLIVIYLFSILYNKYIRTNYYFYYIASIIVLLYPCMFYTGHSRLSMVVPICATVFMLFKLYQERSKKIVISIVTFSVIYLFILSLHKFYGEASVDVLKNELTLAETSSLINAYFGGMKNVMIGLNAYDLNGSDMEIFYNDSFRNVMGLGHYFADKQNSVTLYNSSFYSRGLEIEDQICPTIIEGLLCFGSFFFFIPLVLMVIMVLILDYRWYSSPSLEFSYLCSQVSALIGWCIPGNYMHLSSVMFNFFLPITFLIILNRWSYTFFTSKPN